MSVSRKSNFSGATEPIIPPAEAEFLPLDKRVIIFSSNQCLYQALSSSLESTKGIRCTCLHCLPGGALPDASPDEKSVFLLDCMSLDEQGIDQCFQEDGRHNFNENAIVLFNVHKKWDIHQKTYARQIRGVFLQDDSKSVFIKGMRQVLSGRNWFPQRVAPAPSPSYTHTPQSPEQQLDALSPREKEILHLVSVGMKNTEIALELTISLNTVKTHIYNIYKKISVSNRLQAAIWATAHCVSQG